MVRAGALRSECDGSQDHDLALRASEMAGKITHISRILYHWRMLNTSVSHQGAARCAGAAVRAVQDQQRWPALGGPHNAQNVACAAAAVRLLGLTDAAIEQGLRSFPGLAHRMQVVGNVNGVRYVNDSKATNPTSVAPALQAFPAIHWILGGQAKTAELDACLPYLANVRTAYVIGEAGPLFQEILNPHVPVVHAGTLAAAVAAAAANARTGETVLLSPACASFDQFRDFEARGDAFLAEVERLRP